MNQSNKLVLNNCNLHFRILDLIIEFDCAAPYLASVLMANYGAFKTDADQPDIFYRIEQFGDGVHWRASRTSPSGEQSEQGSDLYSFVYDIEKDMTLELQKARADLYFIHSASLEYKGGAILLSAESGTGKSTTAWALATQGLGYLSDELAPVNLQTLAVHPYPHALCLKSEPPAPYRLPETVLRTERTLHIPVSEIPSIQVEPRPLRALFFLSRKIGDSKPEIRAISAAEAGTRLYTNTLNALAHPGFGLDAALQISRAVPAFLLKIGDLYSTCELLKNTVNQFPTQTETG